MTNYWLFFNPSVPFNSVPFNCFLIQKSIESDPIVHARLGIATPLLNGEYLRYYMNERKVVKKNPSVTFNLNFALIPLQF